MQTLEGIRFVYFCFGFHFFGIFYQGDDIVFRFIIENSSLTNFGPPVIGLFLCEDFWKMIFWLVLKLGINDRIMISWRSLVSFKAFFFRDYIFAWWNIGISIILLLPYHIFSCKWQGHNDTLKRWWRKIFDRCRIGDWNVLVVPRLVTKIHFWLLIIMGATQIWPRIFLHPSWWTH